jgi:hypothetical protein
VLKSVALSGILVFATLGLSTPGAAQERSTVSGAELEAAIRTAPAGNQESVQRFLQDSRVVEAGKRMGVRTADLAASVSTMDEATLNQLAQQTRAANRDLAGGDGTLVIGTTAIIIILLIVILLVVT